MNLSRSTATEQQEREEQLGSHRLCEELQANYYSQVEDKGDGNGNTQLHDLTALLLIKISRRLEQVVLGNCGIAKNLHDGIRMWELGYLP